MTKVRQELPARGGQTASGGKDRCGGGGLGTTGPKEGIAPDETDQRQMAMQPRPGAALVVAQPQFLLAVLMEALDGPALMGQAQLLSQRAVVQRPGEVPEVPLGLAVLAGEGPLADQPA